MDTISVLLVDDEREFVEMLARRLNSRGFQAAIALNADDGLKLVQEQVFHVVVLDIVMPGKDGLVALQEIKSFQPLTEVIMLSGHASLELAIKGLRFGAFDFLVKPPNLGDLVDKLNKAFIHRSDHEERIRKASLIRDQISGGADASGQDDCVAATAPAASDLGILLVIGREDDFPPGLIEYAVNLSRRMSYRILALNVAGFQNESFRLFPAARESVCQEFAEISERNAEVFRRAAQEQGVPFTHIAKCCSRDEAIAEATSEHGDPDYIVCEQDGIADGQVGMTPIVAYTPV